MGAIMDGEATPAQIGALLGGDGRARRDARTRSTGFARAMRARAVPLVVARARSTPAAPAATAPAPSTSRPWRRSWWRPAACRWPSTATARRAAPAAAPTCSRRSASASTRPPATVQTALDEVGWTFLFAPALPRRDPPRRGPAQGAGRAHRLQPARPAHEPGAAGRRRWSACRRPELAAVRGALPAAARDEAGLGRARQRPRRADPGRPHDRGRARTARRCGRSRSSPRGRGPRARAARGAARRRPAGERGHRARGAGRARRGRSATSCCSTPPPRCVVAGPGGATCATARAGGRRDRRRARPARSLERVREALA